MIGLISGVLVVWTGLLLEHRFHIDDPAGAIAVHGFNGIWGVLALGLFADGTYPTAGAFNDVPGPVTGLLYGDTSQLVAQALGATVNLAWVLPVSYAFFVVTDRLLGNRVIPHVEILGLDVPELGAVSYFHDAKTAGPTFGRARAHRAPAGGGASQWGQAFCRCCRRRRQRSGEGNLVQALSAGRGTAPARSSSWFTQ